MLLAYISMQILLLLSEIVEANPTSNVVHQNGTNSTWLKRVANPRAAGCWYRPWICNQGESPPGIRSWCCRNRCVDVTSDVNNCGMCGVRCPFTWQCCQGLCIDTSNSPFNCGKCGNRCPFTSLCFYGMCGYAQPFPMPPPFPFPPGPFKQPRTPRTFPPQLPKPSHPPGIFPPQPSKLPRPPKQPHGPYPPKAGYQPPPPMG